MHLKSLENLFRTFSTAYIRIGVLHFKYFHHPWWSNIKHEERKL